MSSIFNKSDNAEFIKRINSLSADTRPLWGKMTVSQMMPHCGVGIRIAFGEPILKRNLLGMLFGKIAKNKMLADGPLQKNSRTAGVFIIKQHGSFEEEKNTLINQVKRFVDEGTGVLRNDPHPFFGEMTIGEWDKLMCRHLDHHLSQFGV
jgi:hypothetical protein